MHLRSRKRLADDLLRFWTFDWHDDLKLRDDGEPMETQNDIKPPREWWQDPWWEDEAYLDQGLPLEEIRERIDVVKRHCNVDWLRRATEADARNAILPYLGPKGLVPWHALMTFGRTLRAVEQADGFVHKFRALIGSCSAATLFEMQAAELFHRMGFRIAFPRSPSERHPDVTATRNGQSLAIECKQLMTARAETWAQYLGLAMIDKIGATADGNLRGVDVEFEPDLPDLSFDDKPGWNRGLVEEIVTRIRAALRSIAQMNPRPESLRLPGIGKIRVRPDATSLSGSICGVPLSKQKLVRRMVRNAIIDARRQLPSDHLGVVCIHTLLPPPFELLDLVLLGLQRAEPDVLGSIGIVLVLPPESVSTQLPALVWSNPRHTNQLELGQLTDELKIALGKPDGAAMDMSGP
jgi:hypothetical protein